MVDYERHHFPHNSTTSFHHSYHAERDAAFLCPYGNRPSLRKYPVTGPYANIRNCASTGLDDATGESGQARKRVALAVSESFSFTCLWFLYSAPLSCVQSYSAICRWTSKQANIDSVPDAVKGRYDAVATPAMENAVIIVSRLA
jgi:hypothetical protein